MDISKYTELPKNRLISDALCDDNIRYREIAGTGMGDYARLYNCFAEDRSLIFVKIKCWSNWSEYCYELDAENWQKAIETIFKTDKSEEIGKIFKEKTKNFPIRIEDIFQEHEIKYHKWAHY